MDHVADGRHFHLGDHSLAGGLVDVGLGGRLGGLDVLRGVL